MTDDDDDGGFDADERPTLVTCLSCGGRDKIVENKPDGTYRVHNCRWCTRGAMSGTQYELYRAYLRLRRMP